MIEARPSILYVVTRGELGGAQIHVAELLRHFRHRFQAHLACGEEQSWLVDEARRLGITTHHLPDMVRHPSVARDLRAWSSLKALIRKLSPSIVHAHSSKAGVLARLSHSGRTVFTAHGWAFSEGAPLMQRVIGMLAEHLVGRKRHTVITVSHRDRALAEDLHLHRRYAMTTIWNGVQDTPYRANLLSNRVVRIACVARFVKQKDHATLLKALANISSPWTLDLMGSGPLESELRNLASKLDLGERVIFAGARQDVRERLSQADLFVLPTRQEGLPLTILEAMSVGLPIVASETGGIPEIISNGETGFLVRVGDVQDLTDKLAALIANRDLRIALGANARQRYERDFQLETMLERISRVYDQVLSATST